MPVPATRCTGHCCTSFFLQESPEELRRQYLALLLQPPSRRSRREKDAFQVAQMVVLVNDGRSTEQKEWDRTHEHRAWNRGFPFEYSCKNFDPVNKVCLVYETRPHMCRAYPNGQLCDKEGCTWHPDDQMKEWPEDRRPLRLYEGDPETQLRMLLARVEHRQLSRGRRSRRNADFSARGIEAFQSRKEYQEHGLRRRRPGRTQGERGTERLSEGLGPVCQSPGSAEPTDHAHRAGVSDGGGGPLSPVV